jgi:hypothetical protein
VNSDTVMVTITTVNGARAPIRERKLRTNTAPQPIITTTLTPAGISTALHHHAQ